MDTAQDPNATINLIADVAKTLNTDCFGIRITRRGTAGYPESFASFDDATVEQIAHPENWITRIGGGGGYQIVVYHPQEKAKTIGHVNVQIAGPARRDPIDQSVVNELDWRGPRTMTFPLPPAKKANGNGASNTTFIGIPAPSDAGGFPYGGGPGSTPRNGDQRNEGATPVFNPYDRERAQLDREREELRKRTLEIQESAHRAELENERRRNEAELAKIRAEISATARAPVSSGPSELALLMIEMNKQSQAQAERQAEAQRRADERQAEAQRRADEKFAAMMAEQAKATAAQLASAQELNKTLMTTLLAKPEISPVMEKLLAKNDDAGSATAKVVQQMAESMGAVMNVSGQTVQMVVGAMHAIAELNAPETEPGWIKGMREAAKVALAFQGGGAGPMIPPGQMVAGAGGAPGAPGRPTSFGNAPAGAPSAGAPPAQPPETPFARCIRAVKDRVDVAKVATYFLDHKNDPSIVEPMTAAGGNPLNAFAPHLTTWAQADPKNMQYVHSLITELEKQYTERMKAEGADEEEDETEVAPEVATTPASAPENKDPNSLE